MRRIYVLKAAVVAGMPAPILVEEGPGRSFVARKVEVLGPSRLVYRPDAHPARPRVWLETAAALELVDERAARLLLGASPDSEFAGGDCRTSLPGGTSP